MAINDFLLTTDYPIDKIIGYTESSFSAPATTSSTYSTPHGITAFTPLAIVKWSTDPSFSTSYDEIGVSFNFITLNGATDATNLYLYYFNLTASPVTIYYRVYYFMPSNVDVENEETQSDFDAYVLNTDYNYTKIYEQGFSASPAFSVSHDLGYYPQVEAWYILTSNGRTQRLVSGDNSITDSPRVRVTTTSVEFLDGTITPVSGWHYRIYADEV